MHHVAAQAIDHAWKVIRPLKILEKEGWSWVEDSPRRAPMSSEEAQDRAAGGEEYEKFYFADGTQVTASVYQVQIFKTWT